MALPGLLMNAVGMIGSSYNYMPEIFVDLYNAYCASDLRLAQSLQFEANRISYAVKKIGNLSAYKVVLGMRGIDVGDCRPPSLPLANKELEGLKSVVMEYEKRLTAVDFSEGRTSLPQ